MYGKPFNLKRPFGEVHGMPGVAYDQDGQLFNAQQQPVDNTGKIMPLDPAVLAAAKKAPEPVKPAPAATDEDDDTPADEKGIDLLAWANGDEVLQALPWQTVRLEAKKIFEDITELKSKAALKQAIIAHYAANA